MTEIEREERVIGDQTLVRGTGGSNEGHLVTVLHTIEISIYLIIHFEDPPYIKLLKHMSIVRILLMTLIKPIT